MEIQWEESGPESWVEVGDRWLPKVFRLISRPPAGGREPTWTVTFQVRDGVPRCTDVTVSSGEQGREVRVSDLRRLQLGELLEGAAANVAKRRTVDAEGRTHMEVDLRTWRDTRRSVRLARSGMKRRITDELLREVADVYRDSLDSNPTEAVAEHLGGIADRTARLYVKRARDAGFLGAAVRGKAGEVSDG